MKQLPQVIMSDSVNRKNMRMDTGCLYDFVLKRFPGGIPQLFSHDRHRLAGWIVPAAVHFQPGLTRVVAYQLSPETQEESDLLRSRARAFTDNLLLDVPQSSQDELKALLAEHIEPDAIAVNLGAVAMKAPRLAERVFPKLFGGADKDGLIPIENLMMIRPGVFKIGELCVFAHPYFRRSESYLNQFNAELLSSLVDASKVDDVNARLMLDRDLVGLAATGPHAIELDYWFGPTFDDDLSQLEAGVARFEASDLQRAFHQVSRTEFWWQKRIKQGSSDLILEAEEIRDAESGTERSQFLCRYIHSIVDSKSLSIYHLDGSIRGYDSEGLVARLGVDLKEAGRNTEYTKLWRVDGSIPIGTWKILIHNHFRGNPLIAEYFEPKTASPDVQLAPIVEPFDIGALTLWAPSPPQRIRVMLTHMRPMLEELPDELTATAFEFGRSGGSDVGLFDVLSLELKKSLMKRGLELSFRESPCFLEYEDRLIQFPAIVAKSPGALSEAIAAYRDVLGALTPERPASVVSINLALALAPHTLNLSLLGTLEDVRTWLDRPTPFPLGGDVQEWVRSAAESLEEIEDDPVAPVTNVAPQSLVLFPRRRRQVTDLDSILHDEQAVDVGSMPPEVTKAIQEGRLRLAVATRVNPKQCSVCLSDYTQCSCSWLLDNGVELPSADSTHGYTYWSV